MPKKNEGASKSKVPRKKKLKLVDHSPIGLTDEERKELSALYYPLGLQTCRDINDVAGQKKQAIARYLCLYVQGLCHDAGAQNAKSRKNLTTSMRRQIVAQLGKLTGRELSPDDIIKALSKHAPVPKFAVNAIRRDYLRVTV